MAAELSTRPWGQVNAADYESAEAYCQACLLDLNPPGEPKTKARCKLPIREPNGQYNRNALIAAAMALTVGFRGRRVQAPKAAKARAIRRLMALFRRFEMTDLRVYRLLAAELKRLS